MALFFLSFVGIYAVMHLVVWWGVAPLLPSRFALRAAGWAVLMIAAPLSVRLLERGGWDLAAHIAAWVGYLWLGLIFLAFWAFLLLAIFDAGGRLLATLLPVEPFVLHGSRSAAAVLTMVLCCAGYAFFEARTLRIETVRIVSPRLPEALDGVRIVQISDLHLGLINGEAMLDRVAARVAGLRPDLLAVTGDLVDAQIDHLDGLSRRLRDIPARLGKYAVLGNHEYYAGLSQSLNFIDQGGLRLLRNRAEVPAPGFAVVGVDDPVGRNPADPDLTAALHRDHFVLLLKHRPEVTAPSPATFDLQLSGHTHRGQIFPFNLLTRLQYPLQDGLYTLAPKSWLYTSRGTGTWGPPLRLFSPPEVTLIVLQRG